MSITLLRVQYEISEKLEIFNKTLGNLPTLIKAFAIFVYKT